jgi:hypothetical protein
MELFAASGGGSLGGRGRHVALPDGGVTTGDAVPCGGYWGCHLGMGVVMWNMPGGRVTGYCDCAEWEDQDYDYFF